MVHELKTGVEKVMEKARFLMQLLFIPVMWQGDSREGAMSVPTWAWRLLFSKMKDLVTDTVILLSEDVTQLQIGRDVDGIIGVHISEAIFY